MNTPREPILNLPAVVTVLLILMTLIHLIREWLPPEINAWAIAILAFIPARYSEVWQTLPGDPIPAWTSFATHALLHGDWTHLAFNVLCGSRHSVGLSRAGSDPGGSSPSRSGAAQRARRRFLREIGGA